MTKHLLFLLFSGLAAAAAPQSFSVQVKGTGQPMILIPGMASSGETWDATVAHYQDRYQCHVLSLAGFVGKPPIAAPFLETVRKELVEYVRDKKLDHPVIVGHSLGGFLALGIASSNPDLTGKLVIVDALP